MINLPDNWDLLPLEKCMAEVIDYRGKTPNKTNTGIPLITSKIVKGGRINEVQEYIDPKDYDSWMRRGLPQAGDIVMTTEAPLGEIAQLDNRKVALAQRLITLRGKIGLLDNNYLKFLMQSYFVQNQLSLRATGTTVLGIKQSELRKILLILPPLPEQKAIASILSSLDDKIELNQQMNQTLEAMASAIFKSWFVDFDPVRAKMAGNQPVGMDAATANLFPDSFEESALGLIPKGWRVGTVADISHLSKKGLHPNKTPQELFAHYSIPAFDEGKIPKTELGEQIKSNKYIIASNAVLLSKLNPRIPRVWLPSISSENKSICSTEFLVMLPNSSFNREYLYSLFTSQDFFEVFSTLVTGTSGSHQRVKPEFLLNIEIIIPNYSTIKAFTKATKSIYNQTLHNLEQSRTLANIRDTLLPKLMSAGIKSIKV